MKGKWLFFLWLWIFGLLTGCAAAPVEPVSQNTTYPETQAGTAVSQCCEILQGIWKRYREGEQFAVFGGDSFRFVADGPGDLVLTDKSMLGKRFCLTEDLIAEITEGAALEHLLNRNVFCAGVFRMAEGTNAITVSELLQTNLQETVWSGGQPQRLLIAQPEQDFLLLAYGQTSVLETFLIRMNQAYPKGRILLYQEF